MCSKLRARIERLPIQARETNSREITKYAVKLSAPATPTPLEPANGACTQDGPAAATTHQFSAISPHLAPDRTLQRVGLT